MRDERSGIREQRSEIYPGNECVSRERLSDTNGVSPVGGSALDVDLHMRDSASWAGASNQEIAIYTE